MVEGGTLGLLVVASFVLLLGVVAGRLRVSYRLKRLLLIGLGLRVTGALIYVYVIGALYGGGDYLLYFREGVALAKSTVHGGPGSLWDPGIWMEGAWWGTYFVVRVTALLLAVIGPTLPGVFIVFSLLGYAGIVALGLAFHRAFPRVPAERYFVWIVLFPSLWFWPAALGKDALVLCGVGLAALGFVGKQRHPRWLLMALGAALVFAVRPQVAATLAFALIAGHWLAMGRRWSLVRMVQGVVLVAVGVGTVAASSGALGVELFSADQVQSYLESRALVSDYGGSAIGVEGSIPPPLALVNTLFRPFPWEAGGAMSLLASAEVLVLWVLAWLRRREIGAFVRAHRRSRLFWVALVFVLAYGTALGMAVGNVGIIARQRVHILPFLFMFFAGAGPNQARKPRSGAPAASEAPTPDPVGAGWA